MAAATIAKRHAHTGLQTKTNKVPIKTKNKQHMFQNFFFVRFMLNRLDLLAACFQN